MGVVNKQTSRSTARPLVYSAPTDTRRSQEALPRPFQDPCPQPRPEMAVVMDLSARFRGLLLADPLSRVMERGDTLWGDLDLYFPEAMAVGARRTPLAPCFDMEREEEEPAEVSGAVGAPATQQRYTAPPASRPAVAVPPYTPGIKTIIARNLPRDITPEMLRGVFEKYGAVRDVYIPRNMDRNSPYFGTVKGFALIKYNSATDSAAAYENEYGRLQLGKNNITVEFAQADR